MSTWGSLYPVLRMVHIGLAVSSVTLFVIRASAVVLGARWPLRGAWRGASVVIDVGLTVAGGLLWWGLSLHPLQQSWLGVKLVLIVLYIGLGWLALKRSRSLAGRLLALVLALGCVAAVVSVARSHHPLGALQSVGGR